MIGLGAVYGAAGLLFAAFAVLSACDRANSRRWRNALFWGLFAASFLFGNFLSDFWNGMLAFALVAVAACGLGVGRPKTTSSDERRRLARLFGNRLFVPAFAISGVTLAGAFLLKDVMVGGRPLFDPAQTTLIALAASAAVAVILIRTLLRQPFLAALHEGRRLMDLAGAAILLPQMLAALGIVFALAGVGRIVGGLAVHVIPADSRFMAVPVFTVGMAAFTMIMGNAFAAFPVMTAGIGLPFIVNQFGGNPTIMAALGMLSGFSGTLLTPMAANFNLVPVALLGLKDRYQVIKAQTFAALALLLINTVLMDVLVFRL